MLYWVHLAMSGIWTHTLVVKGTDCTDICKSNYHTIPATTDPNCVSNGMVKKQITLIYIYLCTNLPTTTFNSSIAKCWPIQFLQRHNRMSEWLLLNDKQEKMFYSLILARASYIMMTWWCLFHGWTGFLHHYTNAAVSRMQGCTIERLVKISSTINLLFILFVTRFIRGIYY